MCVHLCTITIKAKSLSDRSYVVQDGRTAALVIHPQGDLDRVEQALAEAAVRVTRVAETTSTTTTSAMDWISRDAMTRRIRSTRLVVPVGIRRPELRGGGEIS